MNGVFEDDDSGGQTGARRVSEWYGHCVQWNESGMELIFVDESNNLYGNQCHVREISF